MGHHPEPTEQHDLFYCPMAARWIGVREKLEEKAENLEEILYFMEKRKTSFPVDFLLNQSNYSNRWTVWSLLGPKPGRGTRGSSRRECFMTEDQ